MATAKYYAQKIRQWYDKMEESINYSAAISGFSAFDFEFYVPRLPSVDNPTEESLFELEQLYGTIRTDVKDTISTANSYIRGRRSFFTSREGNTIRYNDLQKNPGLAYLIMRAESSGMPEKQLRSGIVIAANQLSEEDYEIE